MKRFISILWGALLYSVTKGRRNTEAGWEVVRENRERQEAWKKHAAELQRELDEEHSRGWGIRAYDGKRVDYKPFTS